MAKPKSVYVCQSCGYRSAKWLGRCTECNEWSSLVEEVDSGPAPAGALRSTATGGKAQSLTEITLDDWPRIPVGITELDRVLGGGLVPGGLVLLGGDPGIGKSTLLLQALAGVAKSGSKVLYASGEESLQQTAMRAERLNVRHASLMVLAETQLDKILDQAKSLKPALLAVDSVQTMYSADLESLPGSLAQVREVAGRLMTFAKTTNTPVILVGHVTKDGGLAGPKTLEHVVDTVLYFEGERSHQYRVLRATKNRFGSTNELGLFEMQADGLQEVVNPSALFLAERPIGAPGSAVVATLEGTRPLLVEVQALVAHAAGIPRRTAVGIDPNRVQLLLAVLERRAAIDVLSDDVFVNVIGGVRLSEPACDLGLLAAIASSARRRPIDGKTLCFGEVGLAGEVRAVSRVEQRLAEGQALGFRRCVLPEPNRVRMAANATTLGMELIGVREVGEAVAALLDR